MKWSAPAPAALALVLLAVVLTPAVGDHQVADTQEEESREWTTTRYEDRRPAPFGGKETDPIYVIIYFLCALITCLSCLGIQWTEYLHQRFKREHSEELEMPSRDEEAGMPPPIHLEFEKEPVKPWAGPATPDELTSHAPRASMFSKLKHMDFPSPKLLLSSVGSAGRPPPAARGPDLFNEQDVFSLPQSEVGSDVDNRVPETPSSVRKLSSLGGEVAAPPSTIKRLSGMPTPSFTLSPGTEPGDWDTMPTPGSDMYAMRTPGMDAVGLDTPRDPTPGGAATMTPPSLGTTPGEAMGMGMGMGMTPHIQSETPGDTPGGDLQLPTMTPDAGLGTMGLDGPELALSEDFSLGENPNMPQAASGQGFRSLTSGRSSKAGSAGSSAVHSARNSGLTTPSDAVGYRRLDGQLSTEKRRKTSSKFGAMLGLVRADEENSQLESPGSVASMAEAFGVIPMAKRNHERAASSLSFQDASSNLTGSASNVAGTSALHARAESLGSTMQFGSALSLNAEGQTQGGSSGSSNATRITRESTSNLAANTGEDLMLSDFLGSRALSDSGSNVSSISMASSLNTPQNEGTTVINRRFDSIQESEVQAGELPSLARINSGWGASILQRTETMATPRDEEPASPEPKESDSLL